MIEENQLPPEQLQPPGQPMPPEQAPPPGPPPEQQVQPPGQQAPPEQPDIPPDPMTAEKLEGDLVGDEFEMGEPQALQIEAYSDNATKIIYSNDTQPGVLQSLQSDDDPIKSIAQTANMINTQLEASLAETGEKLTEISLCNGAAHLVSELVTLAASADLFVLSRKESLEAFRQTLMLYFKNGLADGTIDPVELQRAVEPLMSDEQRELGTKGMAQHGVSKTAPPNKQGILGGARDGV